jgi:thioredoxin
MSTHSISTAAELDAILDSHEVAVLDFWAPWCPPCRGFMPVFEAVARQNTDMAFCRVNTEEAKELKEAFEVASIPTFVVIRDRVIVSSQAGYLSKEVLADTLEEVRSLDMDEVRRQAAVGS